MTTADLELENAQLRAELARQHSTHTRAVIELRTRLAEAEGKLRDIDTLCESSWINIGAIIPADEMPVDFGRLAVSVEEVQDVLRGESNPAREVFYRAFLDQLDRRDTAVAVLAKIADHTDATDNPTLRDALMALPEEWGYQLNRMRSLTRTGDVAPV